MTSDKKILNHGKRTLKKWSEKKEKLLAQLKLVDFEIHKANILIDAYDELLQTKTTEQAAIIQ